MHSLLLTNMGKIGRKYQSEFCKNYDWFIAVADLGGEERPLSPIFKIFMQFSAKIMLNKIVFEWDAYRPLVDCIPACTAQRGVYLPGGRYLPGGYLPGDVAAQGGVPAWGV